MMMMTSRFFRRNAAASSIVRRSYGNETVRAGKEDLEYGGRRKFLVANIVPGLKKVVHDVVVAYNNSRYGAKPRFNSGSPEEIQFEIPAPGLDMGEIKMSVDSANRFKLVGGENNNGKNKVVYKLDLPKHANFEKAVFKARLEKGMVYVTVTNFQKEAVVLTF